MKNKPLWITVILLTIVTIAFYQKEVNPVVENNKKINKYNTSILSINLETSAGSGVYEEATDSKWPESGYTFNTELSRCEQGSEITWDEETKKVTVSSNKSDKCYVYFDKVVVYLNNYIKSLYTTQGSNNLYHHDGTLENGINDGSYRYAGSYETTNNCVCFGTDTEECDDEHLYRIIGVFNEKNVETEEIESRVKLIKAYEGTESSLGTAPHGDGYKNITYYKGKLNISPGYYWSGSSEQKENSEIWTNSTLNTEVLNGTYLSTLETKWINMLAKTAWKIGKNTYNLPLNKASSIFNIEIVSPTPDPNGNKIDPNGNKVGLMYVSDYGFASSPENWATNLGAYNNDTNRNYNWLYLGTMEWTISPANPGYSGYAFRIVSEGDVSHYFVYGGVGINGTHIIRPVFYLNSNVTYIGGTGTETDPYRIN